MKIKKGTIMNQRIQWFNSDRIRVTSYEFRAV